ncbi:hypothetical protein [Alkalicoccus chagannorensis]|uniref:hypothetical protein n=1 Tax=Alkalicoccus chagannorensis TaxID=427072 RepID=UPI000419F947|nr:hypothetical protein [Alkalicoccus chagannorensis]
MAFGVTREEVQAWRKAVASGEIAFLTHFWYDERFPEHPTVTKAACCSRERLEDWGKEYGLRPEWIHEDSHAPHFDLIGSWEYSILKQEGCLEQLQKLHARIGAKKG